jgi:hypothetical protein
MATIRAGTLDADGARARLKKIILLRDERTLRVHLLLCRMKVPGGPQHPILDGCLGTNATRSSRRKPLLSGKDNGPRLSGKHIPDERQRSDRGGSLRLRDEAGDRLDLGRHGPLGKRISQ